MQQVNISVTAKRTDISNQFKGIITFKNEKGEEVKYNYLCTNPQNPETDILYSWETGQFHIKGIPNKELIESLADKEKCIFAFSIGLVSDVIENTSNMLSHRTTEMMRQFGGDIEGSANRDFKVNEDGYNYLF